MPPNHPSSSTNQSSSGPSNIGAVIGRRTRPLVSALQDTAKSYSTRHIQNHSVSHKSNTSHDFSSGAGHQQQQQQQGRETLDSDTRGNALKRSKLFTSIKKTFSVAAKRPITEERHDAARVSNRKQKQVLYSTPAERSRQPLLSSNFPDGPHTHQHLSTLPAPTIAQIAMGLHTSRTPHHRAINMRHQHQQQQQYPHNLTRRHTSASRSTPQLVTSSTPRRPALKTSSTSTDSHHLPANLRVVSTTSSLSSRTTLTLSTPNSSFIKNGLGLRGLLGNKSKKGHGSGLGDSTFDSRSSASSRKTVRFDDSASV